METYQRMPTAVRDFLEQCFDSLDWGGGVWITPPTMNDQNSLIKEINKKLELCIDIMFVNEICMLTTIDKTMKFCELLRLQSRSHEEYSNALDQVLSFYNKAGHLI